jgi:hypothetical protein
LFCLSKTKLFNFSKLLCCFVEQSDSFPLAFGDNTQKAKAVYRVATVPVLFFIDEHGILYTKRSGEASLEVDERLVLAFLNETTDVSSP